MLPCRQGGGSTLPTAVDVHECLLIAFSLGVPAYEMEGITNGELEIQARRRRVDLTIFSLALLSSSASHDSHGLNLHCNDNVLHIGEQLTISSGKWPELRQC
jgi:hypothetical protein